MSNYFNEEIKERYINSFDNDDTKIALSYMMNAIKKTEEFYNKDIYDMTVNQIGEALHDLACSTLNATYDKVLKIENYIDWAIVNGYRKSNINLLSNVNEKRAWSSQFISDRKNTFFSKSEIIDMMDSLVNDVDKAILLGLFEGINGAGFSEFMNLKMEDVKSDGENYWVELKNEFERNGEIVTEERKMQISELLAKSLEKAWEQYEYHNKNGEADGDDRHKTAEIETSEYIINKIKKGRQGGRPDKSVMNRKVKEFKRVFGYGFLKADHIRKSGIMSMAHEMQKNEILSKEDLEKIAIHYDKWSSDMTIPEKYKCIMRIKDTLNEKSSYSEVYDYELKFEK